VRETERWAKIEKESNLEKHKDEQRKRIRETVRWAKKENERNRKMVKERE
jgi:hypothetical protein